jgi:imidazolonepropionase
MQTLITNAEIATLDAHTSSMKTAARYSNPFGLFSNGYLLARNDQIKSIGPMADLPPHLVDDPSIDHIDAQGRLLTPALIDCHTHIVHGGNRAREFEMRLNGASYTEIANAGGGIVSTVSATRAMSVADLVRSALPRVDALLKEGVCVIEVKSGYGLDRDTELRMLQAARLLAVERPVRIVTSFLGAHAMPADFRGSPEDYIANICIPALLAAHEEGLVDAVDGFCESIAFSAEQLAPLFAKAQELGLPVKLHAEQLSRCGGSLLAAKHEACSVDHVEYANEEDVLALAKAGSVAVLLPGAFYTLRETQKPPVDLFRTYKVPMALATDANPGSSPLTSILIAMNMSCTLFGLTPAEALAGTTRNAAKALGLDDTGILRSGMRADLALWDVEQPAELAYRIGLNPLYLRLFAGQRK